MSCLIKSWDSLRSMGECHFWTIRPRLQYSPTQNSSLYRSRRSANGQRGYYFSSSESEPEEEKQNPHIINKNEISDDFYYEILPKCPICLNHIDISNHLTWVF